MWPGRRENGKTLRGQAYPMELTEAVLPAIAELLGAAMTVEPYRVRGDAVFRIVVHNPVLNADVTLILWPTLRRADVRVGDSALVLKAIDAVLLYPGVEVMFRRRNPAATLFVSVGGRFGMTA